MIEALELSDLPNCQALTLENISLGGVSSKDVIERLERVELKGSSDKASLRQLCTATDPAVHFFQTNRTISTSSSSRRNPDPRTASAWHSASSGPRSRSRW